MEIVIIKRDMVILSPNERYTVPDEIGAQLVDRGSAEDITKVAEEQKKVTKKGAKEAP